MEAADSTLPSPPGARKPLSGLLRLYAELWRTLDGSRRWLALAFALLLASQGLRLALPWLAAQAINVLQLRGLDGLAPAGGWALAMLLTSVLAWSLHGPGRILERNLGFTVRQRTAMGLLDRLLHLPLGWHRRQHSVMVVQRAQQSTSALYDFAQNQFLYLQNAVQLVGPVLALALIAPALGLAALIGLLSISLALTRFDRTMMRLAVEEAERERRYSAMTLEAIGHIGSVHALRQSRGLKRLIAERLEAIRVPLARSILLNEAKWCSVDLLSQGLSLGVLVLYVWMSAHGHTDGTVAASGGVAAPALALGALYMVWQYAQQAGVVISALASHFQTFARQQADYAAADVIRSAPLAHFAAELPASMPSRWNTLALAQLRYRPGAELPLSLRDVSLHLQRGQRYALVGGSGAGKSTLLRVLAGLEVPEAARLTAEDIDTADVLAVARWLQQQATLIPQEVELFEGTLAENLGLAEPLPGAAVTVAPEHALRIAAADFTEARGLAQPVAERGANWSGGQRQRIALARGVLAAQGSPLVLLDEPTAALDPETERRVLAALCDTFAGSVLVVSIHRLHLLDTFDAVLFMADGQLLDAGPAAVLATRCAPFATLLAAQNRPAVEHRAPSSRDPAP